MIVFALAGCTAQSTTLSDSTKPTSNSPSSSIPASVGGLETTLESIYSAVNPSVVSIQVIIPPSATDSGGSALGSGFVWDTRGYIVTNNHVIDGAARITITFYDGTTVDAALVGTDADSDLAVVKVNPDGLQLPPVTMADSAAVQVGQLAVAIGNPFGFQNTMTVGFISAVGRVIPADINAARQTYSIPDIIQTDVSINPGNSGGVLLDDTGAVIGITQSIETTTGSSSGVGFAIPSDIIKLVIPALIDNGHYDHPYLGVSITTLNPDLAAAMNLTSNQRGAIVETITAGGPADKAGLKASTRKTVVNGEQYGIGGDVIIACNGQTIKSSDDVIAFIARSGSVGQIQVEVTLGLRPNS
jgi:2-alkenal reductase